MKAKLSNGIIILINIIVFILFTTGLVLNIFYSNLKIAGIAFQIIGFSYTMFFSINNSLWKPQNIEEYLPSIYFTNREDTLEKIINQLFLIAKKKYQSKSIRIVCEEEDGLGKTELLLKIYNILTNKKITYQNFNEDLISKIKKIRRKLGRIYFETNNSHMSHQTFESKEYILFKSNIIILDNYNSKLDIKADKFIVIFCDKNDNDYSSKNNKVIKLNKFNSCNVSEYYKKKYQESIDSQILDKIMKYTKGNIEKITTVLESKQTIMQFIVCNDMLFTILNYINRSEYKKARSKFQSLTTSEKTDIDNDKELKFKFDFYDADLMHLENDYQNSLDKFEILRTQNLSENEKILIISERISHVYKHLGDFNRALAELKTASDIDKNNESLSIYALLYSELHNKEYFEQMIRIIEEMELNLDKYITEQKDRYNTYKAVILAYENKFNYAHHHIDKAITKYKEINSKFLNNCYFIKGEIFRRESKYKEACARYQLCLDTYNFTNDFDEYSICYIMITFINKLYNIGHNIIEQYTLEEIKEKTHEKNMKYNKNLAMKLDQLLKNKNNNADYEQIKEDFDSYIFILP